MDEVSVVVNHSERATLRVGEVFLKIDGDPARAGVEQRAMTLAPVQTPEILWREPPVLAIAAVRRLHDALLPPWPGVISMPSWRSWTASAPVQARGGVPQYWSGGRVMWGDDDQESMFGDVDESAAHYSLSSRR